MDVRMDPRWSKVFLRRFSARLRMAFRWREMWMYESESCDRCGKLYILEAYWSDEKWLAVNGQYGGGLCPDCFLVLAQEKGIPIGIDDIRWMCVYAFKEKGDGYFDIVKEKTTPEILAEQDKAGREIEEWLQEMDALGRWGRFKRRIKQTFLRKAGGLL